MDAVLEEGAEPIKASRLDLIVFAAAFIAGVVIYLTLHVLLKVQQLWVTAAIVSIMLLYAIVVARIPKLRVRLDQAGDNAYYLGLLFTLMSMAFALYEFANALQGANSAAETSGTAVIIGNFGIALASTIMGIFLRVLLHQMRVDPADVESMTRIELSDASKRVRANLDVVSGDMARFHDEVRQRTGDIIETMARDASEQVRQMASDTAQKLAALSQELAGVQAEVLSKTRELTKDIGVAASETVAAAGRLKAVDAPPLTFSRRLDKIGKKLEDAGTAVETLVGRLGQAGSLAVDTTQTLHGAAATFDSVSRQTLQSQSDIDGRAAGAVERVERALGELAEKFRSEQGAFAELTEQSREAAQQAVRAQAASVEVLEQLLKVTRTVTTVLERNSPPH